MQPASRLALRAAIPGSLILVPNVALAHGEQLIWGFLGLLAVTVVSIAVGLAALRSAPLNYTRRIASVLVVISPVLTYFVLYFSTPNLLWPVVFIPVAPTLLAFVLRPVLLARARSRARAGERT